MASKSSIEWTESTWNPITGCTKISPGCKNCFAERMAHRLQSMGSANYANGFKLAWHEHALEIPLRWKKPQMVFVNSMSDMFHKDVPLEFIHKVFNVMLKASWHTFQILTKRSTRLITLSDELHWAENVWMGVSVELKEYQYRIDNLRNSDAQTKFISFEPLLGSMPSIDLRGIDWVIVGGESGPRARPIEEEWVIQIRDQCISHDIPFFFKQWGGFRKKENGRELQGRTWDQIPAVT